MHTNSSYWTGVYAYGMGAISFSLFFLFFIYLFHSMIPRQPESFQRYTCQSAITKSISIINFKWIFENSIELFLFHPILSSNATAIAHSLSPNIVAFCFSISDAYIRFFFVCALFIVFLRHISFETVLDLISVVPPNYMYIYWAISKTRTKIGLWTHSNTLWKLLQVRASARE